jgi:acetyl-CoA carboxylase, biotin carboxylase subunit
VFETVLVANRGEIATRIIRTCQLLGIKAVAVHSEADAGALHVREADESVLLGPPPAAQSYLDMDALVEAARVTGAQAVHPGYGFLSENAEFARRVRRAGLTWIGPDPDTIEAMGDKIAARNTMAAAGVPVAEGTAMPVLDVEEAVAEAARLGYPLMVKAAAGGGGIGMAAVRDEEGLRAAFQTARTRAERFFGSPAILLERYVPAARHVEVQVLGLPDGRVVALGERDCSVQRRHQKLVEETPSPGVGPQLRERLLAAAVRAAQAVGYRNAGTVEFLVDTSTEDFVFLEMNARLQVEHPVTELVTGVDLVEEQLHVAAGHEPTFDPADPPRCHGHAIEVRVCAEDPVRFLPGPGRITRWVEPSGEGVRVDAGYTQGDVVTPYYDPLMAKLCVWAEDRRSALARLGAAVAAFQVEGPRCNLPFFTELLANSEFTDGHYDTGIVGRMRAG